MRSAGRYFHKSFAFLLYLHPRLRQSAVLIQCCYKSSPSSTFPSTSTLPSQSQLAKEIRWRQQNLEHKQKKRHSRTEPLLSRIDSIAAQRLLISDPQRFSEIKEKSRAVREARQADEKQVDDLLKRGRTESTAPVLPYNIEKNPQLFAAAEEDDSLSTEIALAEEEDVDRGFFISGDNFCDDYSAATTADMPEDDMTEPTREYFGDMADAVEHIEFQQPGQASVPKANNEKVGESADEGDWQSNYGTTEPAEEELSELVVKDAKCAGCGAQFHCQNPSLPGFAPLELLREIERNSKKIPFYQKTDYVCRRCYLLKEYNFLLNVNVAQVDYVAMMSHLKLVQEALILLLVDMTDLPFSINADLPKIIGPNKPMIVIGNKADLLPPDVRDGYLRHYRDCLRHAVADAGISAKFNILKYLLVSAKTGFGVEDLITNIYQNWIGPRGVLRSDIYVVGATNAGKSTLFNAFIQSDLCKVRAMDLVERVTTSIWPGTTLSMLKFPLMNPTPQKLELRRRRLLSMQAWRKKEDWIRRSLYRKTSDPQHVVLQGIIGSTFKEKEESLQPVSATKLIRQFNGELSPEEELEAVEGKKNAEKMSLNDRVFQKGNWCHDTPGSVNNEQVLDLFTLEELINVVPRSIIVPRIFMLFPEQSLLLGAVARLDLLSSSSTPQDKMPVFVTVFASQDLKVNVMKSRVVDTFLQQNRGQPSLGAPIGDEERLKKFPELKGVDLHVDNEHRWKDCGIADVVLSSLGWALLTSEAHSIQVRAWTPSGRGIFLRQPPLLPYAAEYRAKRIQGTSEYTLRPLAEIESSNEEERIRRSGGHYKNFNKERASGRNSAQPHKVVNFDLA